MSPTPAPNRSTEVTGICRDHPEVFVRPPAVNLGMWLTDSDDRRQKFLIGILIPRLNMFDLGDWGCLIKEDQGDKVPPDIIVWRPTMEHFDVLTDTGATWIPKGVVANPAWRWGAVGDIPVPDSGSGQTPGVDIGALVDQIGRLRADIEQARQQIVSRLTTLEAAVNSHVFTAPDYEAKVFGTRVRFAPVK